MPDPGHADDFVADYEVIEDMPVPTLAERKQALVGTIRAMEAAALARIISPARERLMGLDINAVYLKPEAERTEADRALLERMSQLAARKEVVYRHSAVLEVAVEELTEATIDGWIRKGVSRMSAPTAYTEEIADRILDGVMQGRTLIDICSEPGMPCHQHGAAMGGGRPRRLRGALSRASATSAPRRSAARRSTRAEIAERILDRAGNAAAPSLDVCDDDGMPSAGTVSNWAADDREGFRGPLPRGAGHRPCQRSAASPSPTRRNWPNGSWPN